MFLPPGGKSDDHPAGAKGGRARPGSHPPPDESFQMRRAHAQLFHDAPERSMKKARHGPPGAETGDPRHSSRTDRSRSSDRR